jgi:hypothetical protein
MLFRLCIFIKTRNKDKNGYTNRRSSIASQLACFADRPNVQPMWEGPMEYNSMPNGVRTRNARTITIVSIWPLTNGAMRLCRK